MIDEIILNEYRLRLKWNAGPAHHYGQQGWQEHEEEELEDSVELE